MKNKLYFISVFVFSLIPSVAPWEGAAPAKAWCATEGVVLRIDHNGSSFMPVLEFVMDDLDVRDAHNRQIQSAESTYALRQLFLQSLYQLTFAADLRMVRKIWFELEANSHLFNKLVFNVAYPIVRAMPEAIQLSTKRLVHNVYKVWITFFVGVFCASARLKNLIIKPTHNILILRC